MRVLSSNSAELAPEFGIEAGRWDQYTGLGEIPFGAMWCVIPPGGRSKRDCHPERELMVVVKGSADVLAGGSSQAADAGCAVLMDSGEDHVLVNKSADNDLVFLSLYWMCGGAADEA